MSETKWTKGPWRISKVDGTQVLSRDLNAIAVMNGNYDDDKQWPEMEANAQLIAAAPELYAALVWAQSVIGHPDDALADSIIGAALRKAKG